MSLVRGFENADIQLRARVTRQMDDRFGDTDQQSDWEPLITIRGRFEDASTIESSAFNRFVSDTPMAFLDPNRIPEDLDETTSVLPTDAEWPYVDEDWRVEVGHRIYTVTAVREQAFTDRGDPEYLQLELEVT